MGLQKLAMTLVSVFLTVGTRCAQSRSGSVSLGQDNEAGEVRPHHD